MSTPSRNDQIRLDSSMLALLAQAAARGTSVHDVEDYLARLSPEARPVGVQLMEPGAVPPSKEVEEAASGLLSWARNLRSRQPSLIRPPLPNSQPPLMRSPFPNSPFP